MEKKKLLCRRIRKIGFNCAGVMGGIFMGKREDKE